MKVLIFLSSHCTAKHSTQKSPTYAITHWKFVVGKVTVHCFVLQFTTSSGDRSVGDPNLGNARGVIKVVMSWLHLYQWEDTTDVKGNREAKNVGNP
jgi:hypothetical protein